MINFVCGNMFSDLDQADCAVNTVNCNGVMGKGVALEFRNRFPDMFSWYKDLCKARQIQPGHVYPYVDETNLTIFNMATKDDWWNRSEYDWVDSALQDLRDYMMVYYDNHDKLLLMPPPGCGNGGLQWDMVKPMVKRHLKELKCEVRVYEPR